MDESPADCFGGVSGVWDVSSPDKANLFSIFALSESKPGAWLSKWIRSIILWPHHQAGCKALPSHTRHKATVSNFIGAS